MGTVRRVSVLLCCLFAAPAWADALQSGDGFANVPGGPVWYRVVGSGDGKPLMVLHGGPGGTSCGYSRLDPLGSDRPIIRYDQLGTGRSGRPDDDSLWRTEHFVERLHALRTSLGLDDFHLMGHSWGGALAAAYVLEKGTEGIASVVLSSPLLSTSMWIEDANFLRSQMPQDIQDVLDEHEVAGTIDSEEYQAASDEFYRRHVYGGDRVPAPENCEGVIGSSMIYNFMWGPTEFRATGNLLDFDVTDRLGDIDVPVLLVAGEHDEARPERMAQFQQLIPGAELVIIKDAAHGTLSRQPEVYRQVLAKFFDRVEAPNE